MRLGATTTERTYAYRELIRYQLIEGDLHLIRKAAHYCQPIGDSHFWLKIEEKYGIKLGQMKRARPRKEQPEELVIK